MSEAKPRQEAGEVLSETYDGLMSRLEEVVAELEGGELTLEESIERFALGIRISREASKKLDLAEKKVELLVKSAAGEDEAVPFDPEQGQGGS